MDNKDLEKLKKLADANNDIGKINDLLNDMSQFNRKANSLFENIDKNSDYKKYIIALKSAKGMNGNLQFKELPFIEKIRVFQMLREAITAYKTEVSIEELSHIKKSLTGEQENDKRYNDYQRNRSNK